MKHPKTLPDVVHALKAGGAAAAVGVAATAVGATISAMSSAAIIPVGVVVGVLVTAVHYWKTQQARLTAEQSRTLTRRFAELEQQVAETQGLVQLAALRLPFPLAFGGDYALTADAAAVLARQVALSRPDVVVELGSGVSTVLVASLLRAQGRGRVYSLDHEPAWAEETRKQIRAAGLDEHAEVLDAPLVPQQIDGHAFRWYDVPPTVKALARIDLLFVDGPPQALDPGGLPRYPALPAFLTQLSPDAVIFVDDANRPGEQQMVRRWLERYPGWDMRAIATGPGTCLLQRTRQGRSSDKSAGATPSS